ncbi:MAG: DUF1127 domain-containing protein [Marinibacterium sp.]|nr:DUF1127 domain-containing protein [Marinibacterium sp.]
MTQATAYHSQTFTQLIAQDRLPLVAKAAVRFAYVVTVWDQRHRGRVALKHLDPHLLRDIGVAPEDARRESSRHFWQL